MQDITFRVAVAGGGSWGTALAHTLAESGYNVTLIVRDQSLANTINSTHKNSRYLDNYFINKNVYATNDLSVIAQVDVLLLAIPAQSLRDFLHAIKPYLKNNSILVNTAKGIECSSGKTMHQVVLDVVGDKNTHYAILSGPSFAVEVMEKYPTAVVLGCSNIEVGKKLRAMFSSDYFRCYSGGDIIGIELGGALKNVMAIAAGVCDGLGFGHNSRAALLTRGLAEMSRMGEALGAEVITFMGLSGLGDLMLTCTGDLSRNRQVGIRLGKGESLEHILYTLGMVAEGVKTTTAVFEIAQKLQVSMPIVHAVNDILYHNADPKQCVFKLMSRNLKDES